jgi:hypothetical protein
MRGSSGAKLLGRQGDDAIYYCLITYNDVTHLAATFPGARDGSLMVDYTAERRLKCCLD